MEIRYLKDSDKPEICELSYQINNAHHLSEPEVFCKPVALGDDWLFWKESHEKTGGVVPVAVSDSKVIGFVAAEISDAPNLPFLNPIKRCRIATIVVSDTHQNSGVGSALYEKVCEIAKEQGASRINLEVFSFNKSAIDFYEKHGFKGSAIYMSKPLA